MLMFFLMRNLVIVLAIGIAVSAVIALFALSQKSTPSKPTAGNSTISGTFNINGIFPKGATVTLMSREVNIQKTFTDAKTGIVPKDETTWEVKKTAAGKAYEIQAAVKKGAKTLALSSPIYVTAPAKNEVLTFDLESISAKPTPATISGTVGLNGYIPDNATITVQSTPAGRNQLGTVAEKLPAKDGQAFSYTAALAGSSYELYAILYNSEGKEIGRSEFIRLTAPAKGEALSINSSAQPPTPASATAKPSTAVVSGTINFNGAALPNSRIVIFQRTAGTTEFKVAVDNISPIDGTAWQWTGATAGSFYDMLAILKQKQSSGADKDISNSNAITLSAPAAKEVFSLNSGYTLSPASGAININCGNFDSGSNSWNGSISFQNIPNAQSYWFQIGTTNGGIELTNSTQNATSTPTQSINAVYKDGVTYFARYAYATVQNLSAGNAQFSPFSNTTQLRCSK